MSFNTHPARQDAPSGGLLAEHESRFRAYTERYLADPDVQDHRPIALKIEHTLQVLGNASRILDAPSPLDAWGDIPQGGVGGLGGLGYPQLARLAALYHDVGRFEQYRRYNTFHDKKSENHARLGVRALRQSDLLDGLEDEARRFVQTAVMLHNRRFLPRGIAADVGYVTRVVRDADKVDIMRVMVDHFTAPDPADPVVTLHVKEHPTNYTPELYEAVLAGSSGDYTDMRWTNDFKLLILGWIFQLNFRASLDMVRERSLARRLLENLPDTPKMRRLDGIIDTALAPETPAAGESVPE